MSRTRTYPNAENCSLEQLETAINCTPDKQSHQRLLAMRLLLLEVIDFDGLCLGFSIDSSTLTRWIKAFNEQGIDGLIEGHRKGRPKKISSELGEKLVQVFENPEKHGETHWTVTKFHGFVCEQLGEEVSYATVLRFVHEKGFALKVPQPWPDRQDQELRQQFCDKLKELMDNHNVELWFADESGFEGDPRPRQRWIKKGKKGRVTKNGDHVRMNVTGMICPRTGEAFFLELTHSDSETFQVFLDEANKDLELVRKRQILIVDNASWHKKKSLNWGRFEPLFLPPYSPDLNPIERLWLLIKATWFNGYISKNREMLMERLDQALMWVINRADLNRQTCSIKATL